MTLAGIMVALRISKVNLTEARVVIFGSGSAGIGIAEQTRDAIAAESGKPKTEAALQIWCVNMKYYQQ